MVRGGAGAAAGPGNKTTIFLLPMKPQPAVRIGGRGAPRRIIQKKPESTSGLDKLKSVLSSSGYGLKKITEVENCSFVGHDHTVINYQTPEVQALFHKDNQPIGYILKGKGELLSGGGGGNKPNFDLETIAAALAEKGININDLVKKVEESGDKQAFAEICDILKQTDFSKDGPAAKDEQPAEDGAANEEAAG